MKVKYTKYHKDEHGAEFQPGWVAEHSDGEALARIALGVCCEAPTDVFSRRYEAEPSTECVVEPEKPALKKR